MTALLTGPRRTATKPLRVLIVDDSEADVDLLERLLRRQFGAEIHVAQAESGREALIKIDDESFDLALVDYRLPDTDGLSLVGQLSDEHAEIATVLLTGQGSERVAAQAIQRGARDYMVKRDITGEELKTVVESAVAATQRALGESRERQRLSQSNHEMDHYVRSLSHDMTANFMLLENSFNQIKQSCGAEPLPSLLRGVNHVEACLKESKRFLSDMALLTKTGSVHTEPANIDVGRVINELTFELDEELFARGIAVEIDGELPIVWCNETRLRQVLGNLLRNAIKHGCSQAAGKISIDVPQLSAPQGFAWLRIHDNGPGIPADSREAVFLPGKRLANSNASGSGMGLAIVKKIVDNWGGQIYIADCPHGTAFCLCLPNVERLGQNGEPSSELAG